VLPVRPDKEPNRPVLRRLRGTSEWRTFRERPASAEEIREAFRLDPNTNVAIVCGDASRGLVVQDVDEPGQAPEAPATATVRTGRPGHRHFYFQSDNPPASRSFRWGELKSSGGYVLAPESRHTNGAVYEWELEPDVAGVADFDSTELAASLSERAKGGGRKKLCTTSFLLVTRPSPGTDVDGELVRRLGSALGLPDAVLGRPFPCLLHAETRPSAALWRASETGHLLYRDFHAEKHGGSAWLPLSRVRAELAGRRGPLHGPELAVWRLRLGVEAGIFDAVDLETPAPPSDLSVQAVKVLGGFLHLLSVRWIREPDVPAPFAVDFASAWCGVGRRQAHEGFREIRNRGLVRLAGRDGRGTSLWLPREVRPAD
jgi:hypothetical protein